MLTYLGDRLYPFDETVAELVLTADYIRLLPRVMDTSYAAARLSLKEEKTISAKYKKMAKESDGQAKGMCAALTSLEKDMLTKDEELQTEQAEHAETRERLAVAQKTCNVSKKRESTAASELGTILEELEEAKATLQSVNKQLVDIEVWQKKYEAAQSEVKSLQQQLALKQTAMVQRETTNRSTTEAFTLASARADKTQARVTKLEAEAVAKDNDMLNAGWAKRWSKPSCWSLVREAPLGCRMLQLMHLLHFCRKAKRRMRSRGLSC